MAANNCAAQDAVRKVTKNYFRSDPFTGEFSAFLKHIINDPSIKGKELFQRSDTGLFYLHGFYSTHNPFFFKPKKIEVVLAEVEINYSDSAAFTDTILLYQLVAYADSLNEVKKEFEKIHRQIKGGFSKTNYQEQNSKPVATAGWHNYFLSTYALAPVTIMWGKSKETGEAVLNITVRLKANYNRASLPAPLLPGL